MPAFKTNLELNFIDRFSRRFGRAMAKLNKANAKVGSLNRTLKRAGTGFRNLGRGMSGVGRVLSASVTAPIVIASGFMIKAASDAEETANKFNEVFRGIGTEGTDAVARLSEQFKLADSTSQDMLSNVGDLLVGLGLTRKEALELSEAVVGLSVDVASFKNVQGGAEAAANSLTKALLGERESLKTTFKTALSQEEILSRAKKIAAQRFKEGIKTTKLQAKALATLALVTERNKDAIGDFARTQEAFANKMRIAGQVLKRLSETFGKILLPLATRALNVFIKIADSLQALSPQTKKNILIFAAMAAVLGPVLFIGGGLVTSLGFMLIAWTTLVPIITSMVFALGTLVFPLTAAVAGIAALGAIVTIGFIKNEKFRSAIVRLGTEMGKFKQPLKALIQLFANLFDLNIEGQGFFESMATVIDDLTNKIAPMAEALEKVIKFMDVILQKGPSIASILTGGLIGGEKGLTRTRLESDADPLGRTSGITTVPVANEAFRNVNNNNVDVKTEIKVERGGNVTGRTLVNGEERDTFDTGNMIAALG